LEPIMAAGIADCHHAETRAARAAGAIFTRPAERPVWRRTRRGARSRDRR
jgi:hypothetical protein